MSSSSGQAAAPDQYTFKLILLGDALVGKRSLALRYADNHFGKPILSNLRSDFRSRTLHFSGAIAHLQLWDSAGQEWLGRLSSSFYRDADSIVLTFDLTNMASFQNIDHWLKDARDHTTDECLFLLVGNKSDKVDERAVSHDMARSFAESIGVQYIETSSKTSANVEAAFQSIAETLVRKRQESPRLSQDYPVGYVDILAKDYHSDWCFGKDTCSTI